MNAGLSLLDTPSYVILVVFVCFLVLSGIFEHVSPMHCPPCLPWLLGTDSHAGGLDHQQTFCGMGPVVT